MTTVGEHYLKTELNHFRAYQEREEKMRSFRHDINNHLLCLKELAGHGDLKGQRRIYWSCRLYLERADRILYRK